MLHRFRDRRGLSPIFAALIMLGIVTVLFIPIFIWSTGLSEGTRAFWERSGMIATERIVIEEVNLKPALNLASSNCTIYVRNIGKTDVAISDVIISESDSGTTYAYDRSKFTTTNPVTGVTISSAVQGDLVKVYVRPSLGFNPAVGKTYVVKVFTERGVGDIYQVKA